MNIVLSCNFIILLRFPFFFLSLSLFKEASLSISSYGVLTGNLSFVYPWVFLTLINICFNLEVMFFICAKEFVFQFISYFILGIYCFNGWYDIVLNCCILFWVSIFSYVLEINSSFLLWISFFHLLHASLSFASSITAHLLTCFIIFNILILIIVGLFFFLMIILSPASPIFTSYSILWISLYHLFLYQSSVFLNLLILTLLIDNCETMLFIRCSLFLHCF